MYVCTWYYICYPAKCSASIKPQKITKNQKTKDKFVCPFLLPPFGKNKSSHTVVLFVLKLQSICFVYSV